MVRRQFHMRNFFMSWKMSLRLAANPLQAGLGFSSGFLNILLVPQGILLK
jgi:hypothetical protein